MQILFTDGKRSMLMSAITLMKDGDRRVRTLQIFENGSIVEIVTCERRRIGVGNGLSFLILRHTSKETCFCAHNI